MLKGEQADVVAQPSGNTGAHPLTYGDYLRIPELLGLQSPLKMPGVHDEMLFIIVQQVQELWFKQILHELHGVISCIVKRDLIEATRLLTRVNRLTHILGEEVALLETMPPQQFQNFRHVLSNASGFESLQFRELELVSGLTESTFMRLVEKHPDLREMRERWPQTLHEAFVALLAGIDPDPVEALVQIYSHPQKHQRLFTLAESLSEYEVLFSEWRFHHIKLVERTIGDRSVGTAGSSGAGYLTKTLTYRFFPELWEARNQLTARAHPRG